MKSVGAAMLLLAAACCVEAQWRRVDSGTLAWLRAVVFVNEKSGWTAGSNGTLLKTTDGGQSWQRVQTGIADTIRDIHFADDRNGWLLCERDRFAPKGRGRTYIIRTGNGGATWSNLDLPDAESKFLRMLVLRSGDVWLLGEGGNVAELSWRDGMHREIGLPGLYLILDGAEKASGAIVVVGGGGSIYSSNNSGDSWAVASIEGARGKLNAVEFSGSRFGWVVGNRGTIAKSIDGGRHWSLVNSAISEDLLDVRFRDERRGFAVGERGTILGSSDGGNSWALERGGKAGRLERVAIAGDRVIAVGYGGMIIERPLNDPIAPAGKLGKGN